MLMETTELPGFSTVGPPRIQGVASTTTDAGGLADRITSLMTLAVRGLTDMYEPSRDRFPQTMRGNRSESGPTLSHEGDNLRYAAMVALGLGQVPEAEQRLVLAGETAADLARAVARRAESAEDSGAVALAAWAAAEVAGEHAEVLFARLGTLIEAEAAIPTVNISWALSAAVAAATLGDTAALAERIADQLRASQGPNGIFGHVLPADSQGRFRSHVGCFADQVYPIQALARYFAAVGDDRALAAANLCAERICALQGSAGQWWWHYDLRDSSVVEGYPVYSVHQHAMGPMALLELFEAGGTDHRLAVAEGVQWLYSHPEVMDELINDRLGVVWRKVGRREVKKAARVLAAVSTSVKPGLHLPGIDLLCPPGRIDYECRPYELGWLLYAWGANGVIQRVRRADA